MQSTVSLRSLFPLRSRGAVFAALLCLALLLFSACASAANLAGGQSGGKAERKAATQDNGPVSELAHDLARQIDPSSWKLSPQAEFLYYYLVLASALTDNNREVIAIALEALLRLDPSLEVYQDSVTIMLSRGEFADARKTALAGLDKFPDDSLLTLFLSATYSETRQTTKAIELLEKHIAANVADKKIIQVLIRLYINSGQKEKASALFSLLPETDMSVEAELFRAGVLSTVGRNAEARGILNELLADNPDNIELWLELAYLYERENKLEEATKAYRKAAEILPKNTELHFRLAVLYIEQKKPAEAMQALNAALFSPQWGMQAALHFAEAGFHKEAEEILHRAGETGADPDKLALFTSMLRQESGASPLEGLAPLDCITPASPFHASALQQKAHIYFNAGEYVKAHTAARDGRKRYPEQKEFWGLEAYALIKQEKLGEAEAVMRKSLKQHPDDADLLFGLGSVLHEAGKKDDAMKIMEHILTISPNNYQALNYVGYTLADAGKDLDRALALITAAHEQRPDADYIVDSLAWVQYRLGLFDLAWENITRCIALGGDDPIIWDHYGDIALALGKKDEAIRGWSEAIARNPDNVEAIRKKLDALKQ